jgi:hypothetical protein
MARRKRDGATETRWRDEHDDAMSADDATGAKTRWRDERDDLANTKVDDSAEAPCQRR